MSYLRYLCLFAYSNVQHCSFFTCAHPKWQNSQSDDGGHSTEEEEHILYCAHVFVFLLSSTCVPALPVSLNWPCLIAPSVFSKVYKCMIYICKMY